MVTRFCSLDAVLFNLSLCDSPMPDDYQFSTLWGGYVSGMARSLEVRDVFHSYLSLN